MSIEADGPGRRSIRARGRCRGARACPGRGPPRRRHARDQRERQPERSPMPADVEGAAARQHRPVGQVAVEAQRAEQERLRAASAVTGRPAAPPAPHPARGNGRADLHDLAHLPERLDRQVAAALRVVPVGPGREARDERRVVDRHDRRVEHVARRQRIADLEQVVAAEPAGAGDVVGLPVPRSRSRRRPRPAVSVTSGQAGSSTSSAMTRRTEMSW